MHACPEINLENLTNHENNYCLVRPRVSNLPPSTSHLSTYAKFSFLPRRKRHAIDQSFGRHILLPRWCHLNYILKATRRRRGLLHPPAAARHHAPCVENCIREQLRHGPAVVGSCMSHHEKWGPFSRAPMNAHVEGTN